jgi:hypothetical protein
MKKITLFSLLVLTITIVSFSGIAYSRPTYTTEFNTYYGTDGVKGGSTLGSCITCHNTLDGNGYNPYGMDFMIKGHNFEATEPLDSDGDGFDNYTEIYANAFPGDSTSVPAEPTNNPPSANAGPDQTVLVGDTVTLDGSGSQDVDGDQLAWAWSFVSVPAGSSAVLSSTMAVKPTFVTDVGGTYVVKLIVDDGLEASAPDTVTISTQNSAPQADAGLNQNASVGDTVTLDGSGSSDTDGDTLTFNWSFVSLPAGSNAALSDNSAVQPGFTVDLPGTYTVRLVVNDGTLDSDPDTVTVSTGNLAPVADAGADQAAQVGESITLDGSQSQDADGDPLNFVWSFVSAPKGSTAALSDPTAAGPNFVIDLPGIYVVQLIVNDGKVDSTADTVTISTENSAPIADAGKRRNVRVGDTVALDGGQSTDPDGDPLTYSWSFVSRPEAGSMAAAPAAPTGGGSSTFVFVPDVPGTYVVQLIVNDGTVDSNAATCTVRVRKQNQGGKKGGRGGKVFSYQQLESYAGSAFQNSEKDFEYEREGEQKSD